MRRWRRRWQSSNLLMRGIDAEGGNETYRYENSNRHKIEDSDRQPEDGISLFTDRPMEGRGKRYDCVENEPQDDPSRQAARGVLSTRSHWAPLAEFVALAPAGPSGQMLSVGADGRL